MPSGEPLVAGSAIASTAPKVSDFNDEYNNAGTRNNESIPSGSEHFQSGVIESREQAEPDITSEHFQPLPLPEILQSRSEHSQLPAQQPDELLPRLQQAKSDGSALESVLARSESPGPPDITRAHSDNLQATFHRSELRLSSRSGGFLRDRSARNSSGALSPKHPSSAAFAGPSSTSRRSSRRDNFNQRVVYINDPGRTNEKFDLAGNQIRTSKYTWYSFLPRNLYEQFHRIAYVYFLIIVILNQIPQLAVFGRTASLFPLIFVLLITAIKDGYEDWGRHRSDREENNRTALVLEGDRYESKKWKHIQVGEMLKVHANELVPCDMVLLATSDPTGLAYIQTINLDGESNLKTRYALQATIKRHPEQGPISGTLICEHPNRNIYEFSAYMNFEDDDIALGPTNLILRGCELKNTSWVIGVVIYAGQETKAMLNSSGPPSKRSRLEQQMNRETLWLSFFLLVICLVGGIGMAAWVARHDSQLNSFPFYMKSGNYYKFYGFGGEGVFDFLSCIIVFQIMIPISLYISLELVRLGQSFFMIRDIEMFHFEANRPFQCLALNINEDLGQIGYVFSDKTGTLTQNKMEFHTASIDGTNYNNAIVTVEPIGTVEVEGEIENIETVKELLGKRAWRPKVGAKVDPKLVELLQSSSDTEERKAVHDYLLVLAACNTVVPTRVIKSSTGQLEMQVASAGETAPGFIEYQGESPDEQALVSVAASYGYTLLERTSASIVIDILGDIQRFEVLGVHEFDSVRKRMSVVVECPDKSIKLLVKGADTSMLDIVVRPLVEIHDSSATGDDIPLEEKHRAEVYYATMKHLDQYAREGLRTLVVGVKTLESEEVDIWRRQYVKASTSLDDRQELMQTAASLVEKNLTLLGATGIEDKLQDGVPETIASLRDAGIKVWVLTGDKQETAISIGFSCLLLTNDMELVIINENSKESCKEAILSAKARYRILAPQRRKFWWSQNSVKDVNGLTSMSRSANGNQTPEQTTVELMGISKHYAGEPLALIIDGNSLVHALSDDLEQELFELATACKVVLCCRVAPYQKAGIVSLVKRRADEMTLAIGDGANDVAMIQMADVGVGISGQEGRQAVMASDFAIGQFRFLNRLLLVHGHWNYQRLAYMVLYNFYRNAVFVMMLFWYILYEAFSPQSALFDWNLVFYSLIYTSVPTIVVGILDKDVSQKTLLRFPALYGSGQRDEGYNQLLFWLTMLDTLWQSLVLFYVPFFTYRQCDVDIWSLGSLWIIAVVLLVNLHLAMDVRNWTWITHVAIWGSILATYVCLFILDSITATDFLPHYWVIYHIIGSGRYWLDKILILVVALLPRFCCVLIRQRVWPTDIQIAREAEILHGTHSNRYSSLKTA
ncbi:hypothetical protein O6H91_17G086000 [Diphasiastrum complanatum]|uniref:Uncharacterized protein n=5 Tax=Diphasiastrum complanatum TaxID=34168 RepID=A0ACC2B8P8_DIPCM|nr:hypothetical protein O6H91_17G085400 [Diphasiastrum complanatum]KAJ7526170.1 hypothetical protein O6H91_17G085400 [Diphasiastrum complanatum]KAJ7526172.1 hypothetical protein O6H91_17G085400 [Diphasiastrum complanatum]KAJ7526183.1 hypothetical protein O6H91_17G086000 [Diphasiastrum complanatum]KAJ7526185.1 hypothetical protein O6H91_17G086000 [Diphasiastrum complanatum]